MANRDRHRQGLVYGPVRPSGPRDRGRIFGNLLGLFVVVVTLAVLALAIYFFAQQQASQPPPVAPSATPTAAATSPSASPTASPSSSATATSIAVVTLPPVTLPPTMPPTPAPTEVAPTATPGPTVFVPPVMSGPGFITFGTTADSTYRITDPKTTFAIDEPMVWSAHLSQPASANDMRIRILILDPSQPSGQRLFREDEVRPDATAEIFFRRLRPIGVTAGAGLFTIQYVRGDEVLAQGSFLVQ